MSLTERLLELQTIDTAALQLKRRRLDLPELSAARQARSDLLEWERNTSELAQRLAELEASIQQAESESAHIDKDRRRLDGQLRTVIAPREAEALQTEISTLNLRRGLLDERELEALEEQSVVDDKMVMLAEVEASRRETLDLAEAQLAAAEADLDAEVADLDERRQALRAELDEQLLSQYDRLSEHLGVAVARLVGHRCEGCHLELSPAELDTVKAALGEGFAECPQCTRLLVR
jgi:predicted  nucleic acid-binding Zn-ribbon protein